MGFVFPFFFLDFRDLREMRKGIPVTYIGLWQQPHKGVFVDDVVSLFALHITLLGRYVYPLSLTF